MKKNIKPVAALIIYAAFAIFLCQPHFKHFKLIQYLLPVNLCVAGLGCYVLSRRWVSSFPGSVFAGLLYGFGVFVLSLSKYHPAVGSLAALIGWLFCPAAYAPNDKKWKWLAVPLCVLPFAAIILFFQAAAYFKLFAISIHTRLDIKDLAGAVLPLFMAKKISSMVGFYHVPLAGLIFAIPMLIKARRFGVVLIIAAGAAMAFCSSFWNVSPILWWAIPALCCSIIIAAGLQALACAGPADKIWVLATGVILAGLAMMAALIEIQCKKTVSAVMLDYANIAMHTAKMYLVGAISCGMIFGLTILKLRMAWLRWMILIIGLGFDIFYGAVFIVDLIL